MATVVARKIASTPQRTAGETWSAIMKLLAPDPSSAARAELEKVSGIAAATIASESPKEDAFVIYGEGPQIRIYCAFGDDAISGEDVNEDPLRESPTTGDWRMSMPFLPEDLEWAQQKLKSVSTRISGRATGETVEYGKSRTQENGVKSKAPASNVINLQEFLKS